MPPSVLLMQVYQSIAYVVAEIVIRLSGFWATVEGEGVLIMSSYYDFSRPVPIKELEHWMAVEG